MLLIHKTMNKVDLYQNFICSTLNCQPLDGYLLSKNNFPLTFGRRK